MKVTMAEAQEKLQQLLDAVENGEKVTIYREDVPVVELIRSVPEAPTLKEPRKLGTLRGKVVVHDPDWWKPMSDQEVDDFLEGKY